MNHPSKREFFDKEACGWDDRYHQEDKLELQKLVDRFDLRSGECVLDLGTGNGILIPYLLRKVKKKGKVVGVDFSWNMVRGATKASIEENFCLVNASVEALPMKGQTFDCTTCLDTFAHVDDKKEALNEMGRILKERGRLYIVHTLGKKELADRHKEIGGVVQNDVLPPDWKMRAMMKQAGLRDIHFIDQQDLYMVSAKK